MDDLAVSDAALFERMLTVLLEREAVSASALARGRRAAAESGERGDPALNQLGLVADAALTEAWAAVTGLTIVAPPDFPSEPLLTDLLHASYLSQAQAIPIRLDGDTLHVAMLDPLDRFTPMIVAERTALTTVVHLARPGEFASAFARLYEAGAAPAGDSADDNPSIEIGSGLDLDIERLRDLASNAPVIRLVNRLIDQAIERRASDLHIAGTRTGMSVRYRIDGLLQEAEALPAELLPAILSRLKIMAGLDIAERRLPQDGRIRVPWRGREIDLRLATMPHLTGEGAVLRVLDRSHVSLDFAALGLSDTIIQSLREILRQTHGLFLVTGPTGSGKTTTLYAALQAIAKPELNIVTVEDPVEYQLAGVSQIQVSRRIGLDFAGALRAVLRQDPDVIMVGEIRDAETAMVANQAALTGHLVLATVHTNSALAALPRLVDMGVEPYLLASTFRAAMAQRLARRLCPHCREACSAEPFHEALWNLPQGPFFQARGCVQCHDTGYSGRVAIAELAATSEPLRTHLLRSADESTLTETVRSAGWTPMLADGLSKATQGLIGLDELLRVMGTR